jgi:hypothetical protein
MAKEEVELRKPQKVKTGVDSGGVHIRAVREKPNGERTGVEIHDGNLLKDVFLSLINAFSKNKDDRE